jgi:Zn-dependent peptidase ImmA (M78 family)
MLEDNFIKVVEVDKPLDFDGLSAFVDNKIPVIAVNKNFPIERKRFTLLHELGHLLLSFSKASVLSGQSVNTLKTSLNFI